MYTHEKAIIKYETFLKSYDFETSEYAGAISGVYGIKEIMPSSVFKSYRTLPFENLNLCAISDYDSYLTRHYGEYLKLPPVENRQSHHTFKAWWKE